MCAAEAAKDRFFESNGVTIHYVEQGVGEEVVVLLHGFSSSAEESYVRPGVVAELAKTHRVLAVDLRGHGRSGKPHEPAKYGREMAST